MKDIKEIIKKSCSKGAFIAGTCLMFVTILIIRALLWKAAYFNTVDFEQILYNLMSPMDGANTDVFTGFLLHILPSAILICIIVAVVVIILAHIYTVESHMRKVRLFCKPFYLLEKHYLKVNLIVCICAALIGLARIDALSYVKNQFFHQSEFYEKEYVDPNDVKLTFPEEKRNLIYILCESMENTFMSSEYGGAQEENYIPELTELMEENTSFYNTETNNGAWSAYNTDWTVAAMTAQTTGIPLVLPMGVENEENYTAFLPGVTGLGDILEKEGYNQELIIGSDKSFGGRDNLFTTHGNYEIFDYNSAIERGYIPEDYYVFWGYEDIKLFDYAKTEIMNQYAKGEPFNVTLLTVDTHFIEGYQCEECKEAHEDSYLDTLNCSSRQISEFVDWIQQQEFYENTTIVIAGDHPNMGGVYVASVDREYKRTVYYTIINSAVEYTGKKDHLYCTMDFFPTTLAAMGVEIEGNRLGLGTNLFASNLQTLSDKYGHEGLDEELAIYSEFYMKNFIKE